MNVMVPLGGLGTRFQKDGYTRPKPFVRVMGKEMILWLLERLALEHDDQLVIVYNPKFLNMDRWMDEIVKPLHPSVVLVTLDGPTRGAAETVLLGLQALPVDRRERPTMLCDGDAFYTVDIVSRYREICGTSNGTFVFHDTQPKPIYSYVSVEEGSNLVTDIKEKVKISDWANSGCYCFRNGCELETYCEKIIDAGEMQLSQDQKGEFYTSGVIKAMLDDNIPCSVLKIDRDSMHVLGTPSQLRSWVGSWPAQPCLTVGFDLDTALMVPCSDEPNVRNIKFARMLHKQGHHLVVLTTRPADEASVLLERLQLPPHTLRLEDTHLDLFVGRNVVDALAGELDQQTGVYPTDHAAAGGGRKASWPRPHETQRALDFALGVALGALAMSLLSRR